MMDRVIMILLSAVIVERLVWCFACFQNCKRGMRILFKIERPAAQSLIHSFLFHHAIPFRSIKSQFRGSLPAEEKGPAVLGQAEVHTLHEVDFRSCEGFDEMVTRPRLC
jgi:hypothetical protein